MPEYIEKNELMKKLGIAKECSTCQYCADEILCKRATDFVDACEAIVEAPTVDAVQVVRCRNCLHGKSLGDVGTWCDRHEDLWPNAGYCSKAERRPNG